METIDGQYGIDQDSGLIGMLARDEIDIAIADFTPTIDRNLVATSLKNFEFTWLGPMFNFKGFDVHSTLWFLLILTYSY